MITESTKTSYIVETFHKDKWYNKLDTLKDISEESAIAEFKWWVNNHPDEEFRLVHVEHITRKTVIDEDRTYR